MATFTNLDTDTLRTFVKGIELGSFAKAALTVGRSPSAVSGQLRKLEAQVGESLFRKSGRGLELTSSGDLLLGYARRILDINDEALNCIRTAGLDTAVRLGLPVDFAEAWLPAVIAEFSRIHPNVRIEIYTDRSALLSERVSTGKLDLALGWGQAPPTVHSETITSVATGWISSLNAERLLQSGGPVPIVCFDEPCVFRRVGLTALDDLRIPWRIVFVSPSLPGLWAAVEAGMGVTMRTAIALSGHLRMSSVSASHLPSLPPTPIWLQRSGGHLTSEEKSLAGIVTRAVLGSVDKVDSQIT